MSVLSAPPLRLERIEALRYVAAYPHGCWQVRMATGEVHECANLRAFNQVSGLFERAVEAKKRPGTWVELVPAPE